MLDALKKHLVPGLAVVLLPLAAQAGEVTLTGEGAVKYTPDSARVRFTASAEDNLPANASDEVNRMMAQWRSAIDAYRDQLDEYNDADLNLYTRMIPMQERDQEPEKRAVASQTVSFTIDDLALLNPLLAEAQKLGMDYHLGAGNFYHSDENGLQKQALARAIADARSRCDFVAEELDMSCGEVVTLNINGGHHPVPMMRAEAMSAGDAVSSISDRELRASVNATFKLD
ncbi:SIMPL domain-containing protein [Marinobacter goseongensis]|uniref:SIMPL domain-containing protein n=1 Tax=Marinobacter goseongensis TaxID=453838 RepID=UPI002006B2B6|nr:SIMPL domain-containing protein [Marinobacter goseongensis]MCK7552131.1 SIMPL domain-containing protein [Marinobacter goseongensis]